MDPTQPRTDRLLTHARGRRLGAQDWSWDGKRIALLESISVTEAYTVAGGCRDRGKTLLTPKGDPRASRMGRPASARDGKALYVTTDRDFEFQRLARIDLATGKHSYLTTHLPWDVEAFELSHDGRKIAFVSNEAGVTACTCWTRRRAAKSRLRACRWESSAASHGTPMAATWGFRSVRRGHRPTCSRWMWSTGASRAGPPRDRRPEPPRFSDAQPIRWKKTMFFFFFFWLPIYTLTITYCYLGIQATSWKMVLM